VQETAGVCDVLLRCFGAYLLTIFRPRRIHAEPLSDVLFTEEAIFTACSGGAIKCWLRPHVAEEMQAQLHQQDAPS
jgi:hypothetical protein